MVKLTFKFLLNLVHFIFVLKILKDLFLVNIDKGKGLELVYCGMLPVGEEGLGPAPIIESISWNTTLKEEHGDEGLAFLCSGSFGTYCYSRSLSVENNDIQCGWEKVLLLNFLKFIDAVLYTFCSLKRLLLM